MSLFVNSVSAPSMSLCCVALGPARRYDFWLIAAIVSGFVLAVATAHGDHCKSLIQQSRATRVSFAQVDMDEDGRKRTQSSTGELRKGDRWLAAKTAPGAVPHNGIAARHHGLWSPTCLQDPPWRSRNGARIAVVLRGESFRGNVSRSTMNDTEADSAEVAAQLAAYQVNATSADDQLKATLTQLKLLVEPLESFGLSVDVFSATYDTDHYDDLLRLWSGRLRASAKTPRPGSQEENAWQALSLLIEHMWKHKVWYKQVFVLRHDLYLKSNLAELVASRRDATDAFYFPFKMVMLPNAIRNYTEVGLSDPVPDTLQILASRYLGCLVKVLHRGKMWPYEFFRRDLAKHIEEQHLLYVLNYTSNADPAKAWNPLYRFAGRTERSREDTLEERELLDVD